MAKKINEALLPKEEEKIAAIDRMRYTKNAVSATFCYFAIILNVLYFICIYRSNVGNYYYTIMMGVSVLYNLLFMLAVFLCSQGVQKYDKRYGIACLIIGAMQFVRIFILPLRAYHSMITLQGEELRVMGSAQFLRLCIYMVLSGLCLILGGLICLNKAKKLEKHMDTLKV